MAVGLNATEQGTAIVEEGKLSWNQAQDAYLKISKGRLFDIAILALVEEGGFNSKSEAFLWICRMNDDIVSIKKRQDAERRARTDALERENQAIVRTRLRGG
jgi:hypothetical protein